MIPTPTAYYKIDGNGKDGLRTYDMTETNMIYASGLVNQCGVFSTPRRLTRSGKIITGNTGTIAAWVRSSSFSDGGRIFGYGGAGTNAILSFEVRLITGSFRPSVTARTNAGGTADIPYANVALSSNTWYLLSVVSTGSAYKFYVNGVSQSIGLVQGTNSGLWADDVTTTSDFSAIGTIFSNSTPTAFFSGNIDELGLWDVELSAAEQLELYNNGFGLNLYPTTTMFQFFLQ